jgi:hypothetical protein
VRWDELDGRYGSPVVEATVKVYGVTVAMLQGQSWAPRLSNDPRMNVGTTLSPASRMGPP